jgi:hypothetical protein
MSLRTLLAKMTWIFSTPEAGTTGGKQARGDRGRNRDVPPRPRQPPGGTNDSWSVGLVQVAFKAPTEAGTVYQMNIG